MYICNKYLCEKEQRGDSHVTYIHQKRFNDRLRFTSDMHE